MVLHRPAAVCPAGEVCAPLISKTVVLLTFRITLQFIHVIGNPIFRENVTSKFQKSAGAPKHVEVLFS